MRSTPELLTRVPVRPARALPLGQGPDMLADIWYPPGQVLGTAVLLHGGFWREHIDRRHASHMAQALTADGWKIMSVEYPRVPGDPDLTHQAVKTILTELVEGRHLTKGPTVLVGHSVGAQLALWATSTYSLDFTAHVALAPLTSLQQAEELQLGEGAVYSFLGDSAAARPEFDPALLRPPSIPTIIVHGDQDQRVPVSMSEKYVQDRIDIPLVKVPGAGHFDLIDPRSAHWPRVRGALQNARCAQ